MASGGEWVSRTAARFPELKASPATAGAVVLGFSLTSPYFIPVELYLDVESYTFYSCRTIGFRARFSSFL